MKEAVHTFKTVDEILLGAGSVRQLGRIAQRFADRCVLVTGRGSARRSGMLDWVTEILDGAGVKVTVYEGVEEDPSVNTVDGIRALLASTDALLVVGLGGGSTLDAAKAAAGLAREADSTAVFLHGQKATRPGIPMVAVPTVAGTGAEVTPNAVISDPEKKVKASIRNGKFLPAAAIVDPELTYSCPPAVTAASGMDAITQAIESYVSIHASAISDALAFEAFRLLWPNVERAFRNGQDAEARKACSYGSLMAGMSLSAARLGAVHGIAHPVGVRCGIPHGLTCAVLLPEVVKINLPYSAEKFARLTEAAGGDLVQGIIELNERMGLYEEFAKCRIAPEEFDAIADESMPSGSLKANPKEFTREDVIAVLRTVSMAP
jgi:alcohol dehydrogenase class IV